MPPQDISPEATARIERNFKHILMHLDEPLSDRSGIDNERINALRLVTQYLHGNGTTWQEVFRLAAEGEQALTTGTTNSHKIAEEHANLREAFQILKAEYERLQEDYKLATKRKRGKKSTTPSAPLPPVPLTRINRLRYMGESAAALFVAAGYCMTANEPLIQAVPWALFVAAGYIAAARRNGDGPWIRRGVGMFLGAVFANIIGHVFLSNLPSPHIEDKAKNEIATRYPTPTTGIVSEKIPFELPYYESKYWAGKFQVKEIKTKLEKANYETCVTFDLVDFDRAVVGSRVTVITGKDSEICFPSDPAGKPRSLLMNSSIPQR